MIKKTNKKGGIGIIIFFSVLFGVLIIGFGATLLWAVVDYASDELTPIFDGLGMVGDTNMTTVSGYSIDKLDTVIQSFNWIIAIMYLLLLVFTVVFIFISGYQPHPAFMGLFIAFMVLLIFGCIIISNMYEDFYTGNDDIASRLKEQGITSYLILYSPLIMSFIAIIGGIIMFTRQSNAEGGGVSYGGSYGV